MNASVPKRGPRPGIGGALSRWTLGSALGFLVCAACGDAQTGTNGGNTSWLRACNVDADCDEGGCVYGACAPSCAGDARCSQLSDASCADLSSVTCSDQVSACLPACDRDVDCQGIGDGFSCTAGVCQPTCSGMSVSTAEPNSSTVSPEPTTSEPSTPEPASQAGDEYALLPVELTGYSTLPLSDGDILVFGNAPDRAVGVGDWPRALLRYSPSDDAWTELPAPADETASMGYTPDSFAFLADDQRALFVDSITGRQAMVRIYEVATETWRVVPAPGGFLSEHAVQLLDGDLLLTLSNATYRFDAAAEEFVEIGERPMGVVGGALASLSDGRVLEVDGTSVAAALFDPNTDTWQTAAAPAILRESAALIGLPDGRALLVGGIEDADVRTTVSQTEIYDPQTDAWTQGPTLPTPQTTPTLVLLDDEVLSIGGLILPCDTAAPCGGVAVHRLNVDQASAEVLPNIIQQGSPYAHPMGGTRYLLIGSAAYGYYDLESGPLEF